MDYSLDFEIGIVDFRNIIKVIKETYDYDFTDYALISLKRRFEQVIKLHSIKDTDSLITKLREDKSFFQIFLQEIAVESTEMFRDPSLWRYLRDELLPSMIKEVSKLKIWIPLCVSGDELFTLTILLKEQGWLNLVEIVTSCMNDLMISRIKSGLFRNYKIEVSEDNYGRYQGKGKLSDYYKMSNDQAIRDSSLIKNVHFIKQNINFDNSPRDIKLILCRNQLIYFTQNLHDKTLKIFSDSLIAGGYLVLGVKEQTGHIGASYFRLINEAESVYRKI
jgi:chemotaxis protein methyltransferase CheR